MKYTLFLGVNILAYPLYVLWFGLKEAPSLMGELVDAARIIRRGYW